MPVINRQVLRPSETVYLYNVIESVYYNPVVKFHIDLKKCIISFLSSGMPTMTKFLALLLLILYDLSLLEFQQLHNATM